MKHINRYTLGGIAVCTFAGCGGSQVAPTGMTGAASATHGKSWMLPEAKSEDLLYVSNFYGDIYAYSYPSLQLVGELEVNAATQGLCVDKDGDVFVPAWNGKLSATSWVYEYAHGGTQPIATLNDADAAALSCSVDPTTGNLAVVNYFASGSEFGNVEIYPDASGSPTKYYPFSNNTPEWATYDDGGNLFVDGRNEYGYQLAELPSGSSEFSLVTLNKSILMFGLQWNDGYLIIAGDGGSKFGPEYIYRVQVSGSYGTIVGTTTLKSRHNEAAGLAQYWIQGNRIIGAGGGPHYARTLQVWRYPEGGKPINRVNHLGAVGVVLSVLPRKK
jgi:hypothetical protein